MLCTLVKCLSIPTEGIGWGNPHASVNRIKAWPSTCSVTDTHARLPLVSGVVGFMLCCAWSMGLHRQNKWALGTPGRMRGWKVSCMCRVPAARQALALPKDPVSSPSYCSDSWRLDHVPWGCLTPRKCSIPSSVHRQAQQPHPEVQEDSSYICARSGFCLNSICLDANVGQIIVRAAS